MTSEEVLLEIDNLQEQIEELKKEYYSITPYCNNKECGFYYEGHSGNCTWTHEITRCRDYIPEEEE